MPILHKAKCDKYSQGINTLKLNSSACEKYEYGYLGRWYIKLVVTIQFVLALAPDRAVFDGNDVFSILVVSTKKRYSKFSKKVFVFQKICFKVKVSKTLDTFTGCHIKTCRSLKRRSILKIPSTVFRKAYALSVGFKMKTLRKSALEC